MKNKLLDTVYMKLFIENEIYIATVFCRQIRSSGLVSQAAFEVLIFKVFKE